MDCFTDIQLLLAESSPGDLSFLDVSKSQEEFPHAIPVNFDAANGQYGSYCVIV
jgi:hypothetical protein